MERLTDDDVYKHLKHNTEALAKIGIEPDVGTLRYMRLAEYERRDALRCGNCADCCSQAVTLEEYTEKNGLD